MWKLWKLKITVWDDLFWRIKKFAIFCLSHSYYEKFNKFDSSIINFEIDALNNTTQIFITDFHMSGEFFEALNKWHFSCYSVILMKIIPWTLARISFSQFIIKIACHFRIGLVTSILLFLNISGLDSTTGYQW